MKNVLGIIGSPRKLGNSEIMIKEISRNISEPIELNLLRLTDFNIGSCRGCYSCLFKEERCVIKDWLIGMKSRFVEKKDALKAVSVGYRKDGTWIKPPE